MERLEFLLAVPVFSVGSITPLVFNMLLDKIGQLSLFEPQPRSHVGVERLSEIDDDQCAFRDPAFTANRNSPIHRWVPWIPGYSRDFVEDALARHAYGPSVVLDPFAGVGTTLVEADLAGHRSIGFEINPYAAFVAQTKLNAYQVKCENLHEWIRSFREFMQKASREELQPQSEPPCSFRTRTPFYSDEIERKVLLVQDFIAELPDDIASVFKLAFASLMVTFSNYSYEPSLGRKAAAGKPDVEDYPVAEAIVDKLVLMADDTEWYRSHRKDLRRESGVVYAESFFDAYAELEEGYVDLLITSPPYLNNYHYNRNTRPHLYWLGFCASPSDLKHLEELNFGSYWQNARAHERIDLDPAIQNDELRGVLEQVRERNPDKGVYGGNGWANYAARYFNDCARFADGAKWCLRKGGTALVVIGNSILQGVPIPTDRFLGEIAEGRGLKLVNIHIPRDTRVGSSIVNSSVRAGSAGSQRLYESVVELRLA